MILSWFVPGFAAPQGSKRHVGNGRMIESSKALGPWRERIALFSQNATKDVDLIDGAVMARLDFVMRRPISTPKVTPPAVRRPDIDKLARAVLDGITGVVIYDDAQVIDLHTTKRIAEIGEQPGVLIQVSNVEGGA